MNTFTLEKFNSFMSRLASSYGVRTVSEMFSITVPQAIALINKIQESDAFLNQVTTIPVVDIQGTIIQMSAPTSVGYRVNTATAERTPQIVGEPESERTYVCKETYYDTALPYNVLDAYARFSDFEQRVLDAVYRRISLDHLTVGWYGKSTAATTNKTQNPLLEDLHTGWIYDLYTNKPANWVKAESGKNIVLGENGDYKSLDHLAFDLLSLIPMEHRTGREMVLVGSEIVAWENGKLYQEWGHQPTEKNALAVMRKTYGGMPATQPAGFPERGVLVTDPANLQYYYQDSSVRRQVIDNPRRNRIEHFQSVNECFRVGDLDAIAGVNYADIKFSEEVTETETPTPTPDQGGN